MTLGKVTAVLAPAGAIYGIYHGSKHGFTFWKTAGVALLFTVAGAALGSVVDTLAAPDTTTFGFAGAALPGDLGGKKNASGSPKRPKGGNPSSYTQGADGSHYSGSNIALRNAK